MDKRWTAAFLVLTAAGGAFAQPQIERSGFGPRTTTAPPVERLPVRTLAARGAACDRPPVVLWSMVQRAGPGGTGPTLIRFWSDDPTAFVEVGPSGVAGRWFSGLDFDAGGNLYAVTGILEGVPTLLYRLDTTTGAGTLIGDLGLPSTSFVTDLSYDPSTDRMFAMVITSQVGGFFLCDNITQIWSVDRSTGAAVHLFDIEKDNGVMTLGVGLATDVDGTHYLQCHAGPDPITNGDTGDPNCTILSLGTNRLYRLDDNIARLIETPNWSYYPNFDQGMCIDWSGDGRWLWHEGQLGSAQLIGIRANDGTLLGGPLTFDPVFFDPQTVIEPTDIAIMPRSACAFDVNGDGSVDFDDLCAWHENPVDINGGGVDFDDAWCLARAIGVAYADLNTNGHDDACEIALGWASDCDGDGVPDDAQADENRNGVLDACDIDEGHPDSDGDGVPDDGQSFAGGREALVFETDEISLTPLYLTAIGGDLLVTIAEEIFMPPGGSWFDFRRFLYTFVRQGPRWVAADRMATPPPTQESWFDLDLDGDTLAIGFVETVNYFNGVLLMERQGGAWTPVEQILSSETGQFYSWQIELEGDVLAMGSGGQQNDDYSLYLEVCTRVEGVWSAPVQVAPAGLDPNSAFPARFATDGQRIAAIAWENFSAGTWESSVVIFRLDEGAWIEEGRVVSPCGSMLGQSIDIEGDLLAVRGPACGDPNETSVFIYRLVEGTWVFEAEVLAIAGPGYGIDQVCIENGLIYAAEVIEACGRYAPGVRVYTHESGDWVQRDLLSGMSGAAPSVAISVPLGSMSVSDGAVSIASLDINTPFAPGNAPAAFVLTETTDCDNNGLADRYEILAGLAMDTNGDGMLDVCTLCPADLTGDGLLDFFDLQLFLNYFATSDDRADLAVDGVLDFFDLQAFLNLYSAGCP